MKTEWAYKAMIQEKGIEQVLKVSSGYLYKHRNEIKNGVFPSMKTMESRLMKAKYVKVVDTMWVHKHEIDEETIAMLKKAEIAIEQVLKHAEANLKRN